MGNKLAQETSPYLLQHAQNPVYWYAWGTEALQKAKIENKLILVSIGYSACHWCHVMEHESFENDQVAAIMNEHFVCIKIDREERPDIDQIYMTAVQLMTGSGGWPLNCFCLPDQRPVYGGTYFRTDDWMNILMNLANLWNEKPEEALDYAERLTEGIHSSEILVKASGEISYNKVDLKAVFDPWKRSFDMGEGGYNRAPKFPLPNNWQFMVRYASLMKDDAAHVSMRLTLQKMAYGGVYDQIGGGFARYSVDGRWHVPHFEKMLYDNAQLISLYAEAYQYQPDELYRQVVYETLEWVKREMTSPEGGFYSALDADSEGVEGKFYTFTKDKLRGVLGEDEPVFSIYFNCTEEGNWEEEETNIFYRKDDDDELAVKLGMPVNELMATVSRAKSKLFEYRSKRIRPGLDNKILASWNGMMLKGYTDAYRVFNEPEFLHIAVVNAQFILNNLQSAEGKLTRVYKKQPQPNLSPNEWGSSHHWHEAAFLDDYAFIIDAFIGLYEVTFNEEWLNHAKRLTDYTIANFYDPESGLFYYTSAQGEQLIARKQEITDNVIPASNSVMAHNLYKLGHFYDQDDYLHRSAQMLQTVFPHIKTYGSGYSNWAMLLLNEIFGMHEIVITGPLAEEKRIALEKNHIPNKIILGGTSGSLHLLQNRIGTETQIYICKNRTCQFPVTEVAEALKQIS